jgi:hypothetical protein
MKLRKPLLLIVLTVALLVLALILPATASARPGIWFLIPLDYGSSDPTNPTNLNDLLLDPTFEDYRGVLPSAQVEGDTTDLYYRWITWRQGQAQTLFNYRINDAVEIYRSAPGGGFSSSPDDLLIRLTPEQTKAFWLDAENWGKNPGLTFNGKIQAPFYGRWWYWEPVGVLYPPLVAGDYTVHLRFELKRPFLDMWGGYYQGQHHPYKYPAGTYDFWSWFTVTE